MGMYNIWSGWPGVLQNELRQLQKQGAATLQPQPCDIDMDGRGLV